MSRTLLIRSGGILLCVKGIESRRTKVKAYHILQIMLESRPPWRLFLMTRFWAWREKKTVFLKEYFRCEIRRLSKFGNVTTILFSSTVWGDKFSIKHSELKRRQCLFKWNISVAVPSSFGFQQRLACSHHKHDPPLTDYFAVALKSKLFFFPYRK